MNRSIERFVGLVLIVGGLAWAVTLCAIAVMCVKFAFFGG